MLDSVKLSPYQRNRPYSVISKRRLSALTRSFKKECSRFSSTLFNPLRHFTTAKI